MQTSQGKKIGPRQIRLYLMLFGLSFMICGIWFYFDQRDFEARAKKTMGTVIEVKRETSSTTSGGRSTTSVVYRPIIRFKINGKHYSFASKSAAGSYKEMKGTRLEILYDPADPGNARVADDQTWLIIGIFIGAGALIVCAGVFLPRVFKKNDAVTA